MDCAQPWSSLPGPRSHAVSKGNKSESAGPIFYSFVLSLPLLGMFIYFVNFQTYV